MELPKERIIFFHIGSLMRLVVRISQKDSIRDGIDLTFEQRIILFELGHQDGQSQHELAFSTAIDRSCVTRLIDNMIKGGLVSRAPDPNDRRINRIYTTSKGKEIRNKLIKTGKRLHCELLKGIEKEKMDTWFEVMECLTENCRRKEEKLIQMLRE